MSLVAIMKLILMKKRRYIPDLVDAMADCDANYIRLMKLHGWNLEKDHLLFAIPLGGNGGEEAQVEIRVVERCPYTTMLVLSVGSPRIDDWIKWPVLEIRVYHDLRTAEVVSYANHRQIQYRYEYPNPCMYQPDEKSQTNKYLGELLTFCINHGHSVEYRMTEYQH